MARLFRTGDNAVFLTSLGEALHKKDVTYEIETALSNLPGSYGTPKGTTTRRLMGFVSTNPSLQMGCPI
jgi:hypothetical protein